MKAKDLRIGNYIDYFGKTVIVDGFINDSNTQYRISCKDKKGDLPNLCQVVDGFEGIPLTEEWLVKFGFEFSKGYIDGWEIKESVFGITSTDQDEGIYRYTCWEYTHGIGIKHVHQLQNLYFALTGQELKKKEKKETKFSPPR